MLIPLGEMRDEATVLTPVRTTDEAGGEVITYQPGDPIFIALRATGSNEAVQFTQMAVDVTHVVYGHWFDLNAINGEQRLRLEESGQEFDIVGAAINDPKRAWTRLNVVLRVNG